MSIWHFIFKFVSNFFRSDEILKNVCCVILAAGEGKRMKSSEPKVLSSVLFEPMVGWVINTVVNCGIADICVVTGYKYKKLREYLDSLGHNLESVIQHERKGTAHAVMTAVDFLKKNINGDVLILGGDAPFIDKATITKAYKIHKNSSNAATIISARVDNPTGYGRIIRNNEDYGVEAIVEESDANFSERSICEINSGAYWFKVKDLIECLDKVTNETSQNEYYLTSTIELLIKGGYRVDAFETPSSDVALGANDTRQLQNLNEIARNKVIDGLMEEGVKIPCRDGIIVDKWVKVGSGTTIFPGTILMGNTVIGKECMIGPNSQIIDSRIGSRVTINQSYCKNAKIDDDQHVGPFASILNIEDLMSN